MRTGADEGVDELGVVDRVVGRVGSRDRSCDTLLQLRRGLRVHRDGDEQRTESDAQGEHDGVRQSGLLRAGMLLIRLAFCHVACGRPFAVSRESSDSPERIQQKQEKTGRLYNRSQENDRRTGR